MTLISPPFITRRKNNEKRGIRRLRTIVTLLL